MGQRRNAVQIIMEILSLSLNGVKITRLMYGANLSYSTLTRYLSTLTVQGLIRGGKDWDGSMIYRATDKGKLLLLTLQDVKECLSV
jgi:predicted transcriptional regulator